MRRTHAHTHTHTHTDGKMHGVLQDGKTALQIAKGMKRLEVVAVIAEHIKSQDGSTVSSKPPPPDRDTSPLATASADAEPADAESADAEAAGAASANIQRAGSQAIAKAPKKFANPVAAGVAKRVAKNKKSSLVTVSADAESVEAESAAADAKATAKAPKKVTSSAKGLAAAGKPEANTEMSQKH